MKKSLKVLCFVLSAIVALLIIAAIVISLFAGDDLKNTIESVGTKALNVGAWIFNKIVDLIIFCGRPVWNAYIKIIYKVGPMFVTGLWYEVVVKVAGVLGLLILGIGIFRFVVTQSRDDATGTAPGIVYLVGLIWLLFCAIVVASLVGAFVVFKVGDKKTDGAVATVSMAVKAVNDAPTANDDNVTTQEDEPVSVTLAGNDPDGDSLSYSVVKSPSHGRLSGTAPKLRYSPTANFNGSDSFTFKVSDKKTDSATATVSITIKAVNDAPTANDDRVIMQEDSPIVRIDVLANDTDLDDDSLKISTVTQGTNGSVTINADNMLSYAPKADFCGSDAFTYTVYDGKDGTDTATVNVKVKAVNDAPSFTSTPVTTATVDTLYTYEVDATDPDAGDTLAYSLAINPTGMTIDAVTGLIQWTPTSAQAGANDVAVEVADNGSVPASETQSYTITAALPSTPVITALTIADDSKQKVKKILSLAGKSDVVQASDDSRGEIDSGLYTSYDFSDISIPAGAEIVSVVVYVEHFEQEGFPDGKLQWAAGTGWPSNPVVWASMNAPVHEEELNEATDSWNITSFVDTPEKVNSLQLQVKNNDDIAKRKTLVDYIYVVVEWY